MQLGEEKNKQYKIQCVFLSPNNSSWLFLCPTLLSDSVINEWKIHYLSYKSNAGSVVVVAAIVVLLLYFLAEMLSTRYVAI